MFFMNGLELGYVKLAFLITIDGDLNQLTELVLSGLLTVKLTSPISFPRVSQVALVVKNPPANAGDLRNVSSIPGWGRYPGGGHGNPFQYSWLESLMDRGARRATQSMGSQRAGRGRAGRHSFLYCALRKSHRLSALRVESHAWVN